MCSRRRAPLLLALAVATAVVVVFSSAIRSTPQQALSGALVQPAQPTPPIPIETLDSQASASASGSRGSACGTSALVPFRHGNLSRSYRLYVPCSPASSPRPLVVFLHCFGCPCDARFGFEELADTHGYVLAKPCGDIAGGYPGWNAGACCGQPMALGLDDAGFIDAVVSSLVASSAPAVNKSAVFLSGFSNGGFMTR